MPAINANDLLGKVGPALVDITRQLTAASEAVTDANRRLVELGLPGFPGIAEAAAEVADLAGDVDGFRQHIAEVAATYPWIELPCPPPTT